nr:pheST operon leader peptide PheM [Serratia fonticola]
MHAVIFRFFFYFSV